MCELLYTSVGKLLLVLALWQIFFGKVFGEQSQIMKRHSKNQKP